MYKKTIAYLKFCLTICCLFNCPFHSLAQQAKIVVPTGHSAVVTDASLFNNNNYLLTCSRDNTIRIWDIENKKEINILFGDKGRDAFGFGAVTGNNKFLFRGGSKQASVWKMPQLEKVIEINFNGFAKDFFSPPGSGNMYYRVSNSTSWDLFLLAFNSKEPKKIFSSKKECKWQKIFYSPNGDYALYSPWESYENTDVEKIDLTSGITHSILSGLKKVEGLQIISANVAVYWTADKQVVYFDPETGKELMTKSLPYIGEGMAFFPDKKTFAVTDKSLAEGVISFYDLETQKLKFNTPKIHSKTIEALRVSNNGKFLLSYLADQEAVVWDVNTGQPVFKTADASIRTTQPTLARFAPDRSYILANDAGGQQIINWNVLKSSPLYFSGNYRTENYAVDFDISPEGLQFTSANKEGKAAIFNAEDGVEIKNFNAISSGGVWIKNTSLIHLIEKRETDKQYQKIDTKNNEAVQAADYSSHNYKMFSTDRKLNLLGIVHSDIEIHNLENGEIKKIPIVKNAGIQSICFDWKNNRLLAGYTSYKKGVPATYAYNISTLKQEDKYEIALGQTAFQPEKELLAGISLQSEFEIVLFSTLQKKVAHVLKGHTGNVLSVQFSENGEYVISTATDNSTKIWNTATGKELATLYTFDNGGWAVVTPDGRFDASEEEQKKVYLSTGMDTYPLANLYETFYTPRLLYRLLQGEVFEPLSINFGQLQQKPGVRILYTEEGTEGPMFLSGTSYENKSGIADITALAFADEGRVDEIRIFLNGKLVEKYSRGMTVTTDTSGVGMNYRISLIPGINTISAVALNTQRTESTPFSIRVNYKAPNNVPPTKPSPVANSGTANIDPNATLHLFVVGINNYSGKLNPLQYAVPDAIAIEKELKQSLGKLTREIKTHLFTNEKATKENIERTFKQITLEAKQEDVFVFYYAGHGYIYPKTKEFYLVAANVLNASESLEAYGITAAELQKLAVEIPALKQLYILDACQSAGAFEELYKRDNELFKSLSLLAHETGTHWIAASGSNETAKEFSEIGHGAFTYSMLQTLNSNTTNTLRITVNSLKKALEIHVPQILKKYNSSPQFPVSFGSGVDFPIKE